MADLRKIEKRRKGEWLLKSDRELKKSLDEIRKIRFQKGLDEKNLISYNKLVKASFRFQPLVKILKEANIKDE